MFFPKLRLGIYSEKKSWNYVGMPKKPNPTKKKNNNNNEKQTQQPPNPPKPTLLLHLSDLKPGPEGVPIFAYNHSEGHGAVIGGHVYRGQALRNLTGRYLFGDLFTKYEIAIYIITSNTIHGLSTPKWEYYFKSKYQTSTLSELVSKTC